MRPCCSWPARTPAGAEAWWTMQSDLAENEFEPEGPGPEDLDDETIDVMPCPACGAEIYEDSERCPKCGQ